MRALKKFAVAALATTMMTTPVLADTAVVNDYCVNLRYGNGTEYGIVAQLPKGMEVNLLQWDDGTGWAFVETAYGTGHIANYLLDYSQAIPDVQSIANQYGSLTDRLIIVDTGACPRTYVFHAGNGWELEAVFNCSVGAPESPTPIGEFYITCKRDILYSGETWEYNVCDFAYDEYGAWCFHSTLFKPGTYDPVDDRLGCHISNGCVRLTLSDSEWIWANCGNGTKVVII